MMKAAEFVAQSEEIITTGTRQQEALDALQALGFYVSCGVITLERFNELCRVVRTRFPES